MNLRNRCIGSILLILSSGLCSKNAIAGSFIPVGLTDTKQSFTATFRWDGQTPSDVLYFDVDRSNFLNKCLDTGSICWTFNVAFSDNEINGYNLLVSGQHNTKADDGDSEEGTILSAVVDNVLGFPGDGVNGLPKTENLSKQIFIQTVPHNHAPNPNHSDLYQLFYNRPKADSDITFTFTGSHVPVDIQIPEPSAALSLLALGTLGTGAALNRKLKRSKSTEKKTEKIS